MNKKVKIGLVSILLIGVFGVIISTLLPVEYDSKTCSVDFKTFISRRYIGYLDELVCSELGNDYEIASTAEDIAKTIEWKNRTIDCSAFFVVHGKVTNDIVIFHFEGRRYWYNKYKWKIID